jgi:multiple sugar transport system ATP-binding protein
LTLGDRLAVMRSGVLQQVGPPGELYSQPVNLFVAGFIGSPAMNFLPGELGGDSVKLPIGNVPLSDEQRQRLSGGATEAGVKRVIAGLRPEHFEDPAVVQDRAAGITFKAKIDVLESVGSESYAYFEVASEQVSHTELEEIAKDTGTDRPGSEGGIQIVARLDAASRIRQGDDAELWYHSTQLHLFDAESGRNLMAAPAAGAPAAAPTEPAPQAPTPPAPPAPSG